MNDPVTCQLCGQRDLTRFEVPGSTVLWRCEPCELYQYGQMVDESAYQASYHIGYERHRRQKVRAAQVRLSRIESLLATAGQRPRLLEIGCSVGCTLEAAQARGWRGVGVDVSRDAVQWCRRKGFEAYPVGTLRLPFEDSVFDAVCAWHVIEHVEDVRATLKEWKRVLKPGGVLAIETPDAACPKARRLGPRYRKFWAPEHTYTFTAKNLSRFFAEAGLEGLPAPVLGSCQSQSLGQTAYACLYSGYHWSRSVIGIEKAFQLFGRKPVKAGHVAGRESWSRRAA